MFVPGRQQANPTLEEETRVFLKEVGWISLVSSSQTNIDVFAQGKSSTWHKIGIGRTCERMEPKHVLEICVVNTWPKR